MAVHRRTFGGRWGATLLLCRRLWLWFWRPHNIRHHLSTLVPSAMRLCTKRIHLQGAARLHHNDNRTLMLHSQSAPDHLQCQCFSQPPRQSPQRHESNEAHKLPSSYLFQRHKCPLRVPRAPCSDAPSWDLGCHGRLPRRGRPPHSQGSAVKSAQRVPQATPSLGWRAQGVTAPPASRREPQLIIGHDEILATCCSWKHSPPKGEACRLKGQLQIPLSGKIMICLGPGRLPA